MNLRKSIGFDLKFVTEDKRWRIFDKNQIENVRFCSEIVQFCPLQKGKAYGIILTRDIFNSLLLYKIGARDQKEVNKHEQV